MYNQLENSGLYILFFIAIIVVGRFNLLLINLVSCLHLPYLISLSTTLTLLSLPYELIVPVALPTFMSRGSSSIKFNWWHLVEYQMVHWKNLNLHNII